ncbi:unnamed protein product [Trifolium pratense]|uniref:Uncharacterized protein n=1 Tax=Trifolium pratense TaxID=57577 RepID=A0ACB0JU68_TRIPR|nr:unnamed protein product [Trifolium pratense]
MAGVTASSSKSIQRRRPPIVRIVVAGDSQTVKVPVIVVGCKVDLQDENQQVSLEQMMSQLMQQFCENEACIQCSAYSSIQVSDVFFLAQKATLYPTAPLVDKDSKTLKLRCARALKQIFILYDRDRDGALSDAELNDFQVLIFSSHNEC